VSANECPTDLSILRMTWRLAAKDQASRVELKRNPNFGTLPKLLVRMKNQTGAFVAPAHRSTLLHLLNTINSATQCSVMLPPGVQSIIHAEGVGAEVAVR
jgi:hypothetical protein